MSEREPFSIDPETIAALLDGRLRGEERERVLAAIDASPELLAIVGDAAEARELVSPADRPAEERADPPAAKPADVVTSAPLRSPPEASPPPLAFRRRPRWLFPTLAAAALIVIIAIPLMTRGVRGTNADLLMPRFIALLSRPTATSGELPGDAWGALRGANDGASSDGRVVRIGAQLVDAHLLNAAGDTALHGVATQIAALLENFPGGGMDAPTFRRLATTAPGPTADSALRAGTKGVESVLQSESLRAGAWLETARIASARGDTAFFNAPATDSEKRELLTVAQGANRPVADSLVAAVSTQPRDMSVIGNLATRLLAALAH